MKRHTVDEILGAAYSMCGRKVPVVVSEHNEEHREERNEFLYSGLRGHDQVTALVPAYNEEACIAETIESLKKQTVPFYQIIVINDCSQDRTAEVAASCGARVITPPSNCGKSKALNFGIEHVESEFFLSIDADTILEPECVEHLIPHMFYSNVGAVSGYVLPRHVTTGWERARFIEYIIGQGLNKKAQNNARCVLISAGCCSLYRTQIVRELGGYSERTITEDLDLTWTLYEKGYQARFESRAKCFSLEPKNLNIYLKQLDRWDRGMFQNLRVHSAKTRGKLKIISILYLADAVIAPVMMVYLAFSLSLGWSMFLLLFLLMEVIVPGLFATLVQWKYRNKVWQYLPWYIVVRPLSIYAYLRAFYRECVKGEKLTVWVKGH